MDSATANLEQLSLGHGDANTEFLLSASPSVDHFNEYWRRRSGGLMKEEPEHMENLRKLIEEQSAERKLCLPRTCLFCSDTFDGTVKTLFTHMFDVHKFNIGLVENLVHVDELLDVLRDRFSNLQCMYCEKVFKNKQVLREHMRKKKHARINPKNTLYDRYYIINYLEPGKNWEVLEAEKDVSDDENEKPDGFEDWNEEVLEETKCLFCERVFPSVDEVLQHAKVSHAFDLKQIRKEWNLDFYATVRLINFVRRKVSELTCPCCLQVSANFEELKRHMALEKHCSVDRWSPFWKDAQYLFPEIEGDPLLVGFDEEDLDAEDVSEFTGRSPAAKSSPLTIGK